METNDSARIANGLQGFLKKLAIFRSCYGEHFALVLIVPDDFVNLVQTFNDGHQAYDLLWKRSRYKKELEAFHSS
jgi:hypothetical protein